MSTALSVSRPVPQTPFLAIVPDLTRYAYSRFRFYSPDAREEAGAEAVAHAWVAYTGLVQRGRGEVIQKPGFVINCVHPVVSGRPAGGCSSATEALSRQVQRRRGFQVRSICSPQPEGGMLQNLLEDRRTSPADLAAFRMDFGAWLARQSPRHRRMMKLLASGEQASRVADRFGISRPRVSQLRLAWRAAWARFLGEGDGVPAGGG